MKPASASAVRMRQHTSHVGFTLQNMTHQPAHAPLRHIVLDTETTGLSAKHGERIIEIACLELIDFKPTGRTLHHYINPQRRCHPEATQVHGITDAFLQDKPTFAELADDILAFVAGATLVIHNAPFDLGFLNAELLRLKRPALQKQIAGVVDTLSIARKSFPNQRNSLDGLCERFGVDRSARHFHGALLDAQLLAEVYQRLHKQAAERELLAKLNHPKAPCPLTHHGDWLTHLTGCLPTDARMEVTLVLHYAANAKANPQQHTPGRCSYHVRALDVALSSMPASQCRLIHINAFEGDAPCGQT